MSGGTTQGKGAALTRVLVIGDGQASDRIAAQPDFDPLTEQTVDDAIVRLEREQVDSVVASTEGEGPNFVQRLCDAHPSLPILLVVADNSPSTVTSALEAGADDVVSKAHLEAKSPVLATRVRNVVARHQNDLPEQGSQTQDEPNQAGNTDITLFETVGSPVAYVEYIDGRPQIQEVNPAFAETFGVERSGVVGSDIDEIVASPARRAEAIELSMRAHADIPEAVEVVRDTVDGSRPFLLCLASVDEENERLFAAYTDISERKQRERNLEQLNEHVSSLHEAAHRLLTAESEAAVYKETVRTAIDILDFDWCVTSRPKNGRFELTGASDESPFEVGEAPLAVGEGTSGQAFETGDASLVVDVDGDRLADAEQLQRVFENLFRNSTEHGDARTVRIEPFDHGFAIVDDGTGFNDAETALELGASANGGTGLGLTIVKRIADAHDWTVTAQNEPDGGARIEIGDVRPL